MFGFRHRAMDEARAKALAGCPSSVIIKAVG